MVQKRCYMGRFEILKTKQIISSDNHIVEKPDKNVLLSIDKVNKSLGQHRSITVCNHDGKYLVVDGNKHFQSLKRIGEKKVLCFNLGDLNDGEYEMYRLVFNIHQARLKYLDIAELITKLKQKDIKLTTISNKTGIDLQSVERYSTLLDFDWDEFNRKQFNEQINPFDDER